MEIKFIKREDIIDMILDRINNNENIDKEMKQMLIDFTK